MPTLNDRAYELANGLATDANQLGIAVSTLGCGTRIIDCGVHARGSAEAGIRLAHICMGGAGIATFVRADPEAWEGPAIRCDGRNDPIATCLASQYAGWAIQGEKFFAMGSGPMRAAACREALFQEIGHCERPERCVGVLETSKLPPDAVCRDIADKCGVKPDRLTLLAARTASEAGVVQIVARSLETALHKLHTIKFDLSCIRGGWGIAPLPPHGGDDVTALGRTNDAILYGASVHVVVETEDSVLEEIGPRVPSNSSPDHGHPFGEIFARYDHDFYRIDPMLFSPARITFLNHATNHSFHFGEFAPEILAASFTTKK
ncbi:MAG: methenyltetrahydromethanopterin cyclohydrolase [Pirellulales bacterium]